jgi:hypothetical protein
MFLSKVKTFTKLAFLMIQLIISMTVCEIQLCQRLTSMN